MYTASSDKTLKQWNTYTGECLKTFKGHEGDVFGLCLGDNVLFSASRDKSIKMWKISSGEKLKSFRGHLSTVYACVLMDDFMFSGSVCLFNGCKM